MNGILPALANSAYERHRDALAKLAKNPPRTLLIEGATENCRLEAGKFWAMLHNCPASLAFLKNSGKGAPCLNCPVCKQISQGEWNDLQIFDGRISNRQDDENPGTIKALRMENIRNLKALLASKPKNDGQRVILVQGMGISREEAQNSLLKALEEPAPGNLFVLLVSQRQQILPTLASRSFCFTFPWGSSSQEAAGEIKLLAELVGFLKTGHGFLDKISQKGQFDSSIAGNLLLEMQKALVRAASQKDISSPDTLDAFFARQNVAQIAQISRWIAESLEMLDLGVAPARVLEGLATRLFISGKQKI